MADTDSAPSYGVAEPWRSRNWITRLSEAPYLAIVIIGIVRITSTSLLRSPTATYWVVMTPIAAFFVSL
jgi:hypothetical protein